MQLDFGKANRGCLLPIDAKCKQHISIYLNMLSTHICYSFVFIRLLLQLLLEPSLACLSGILICLHQRCACARSQASKSMFCAHLSEKVPPSQPTVMECLACLAHAAPMSVVLASTSRWVKKMASCHLLGHFLGFQRRRMPGFGLGEIKGACSRPWTAWLPIWLTPTQAFYFQTVLMRFNDCLLDCAHLRSCPYLDRTTEADWSAVP